MSGKLFLVGTPIGNLEDISARALRTVREVSFIACEDTRRSRALLTHFGISKEVVSLPGFAEAQRTPRILQRLTAGEDCALITDAGTPGISDPGEKLVAKAIEAGIPLHPIPGPSALITALSACGLPTGRFHFFGFLPRGGLERGKVLEEIEALSGTVVLYESPRRIIDTLKELARVLGDRPACIARELTKTYEEFARGTLRSLIAQFESREILGEIVLIVAGRSGEKRWTEEQVRRALELGLSEGERLKSLAKELGRRCGWTSQKVYEIGLSLRRP